MTIKIGEKQPLPCTGCGEFEGYQYSDFLKIHYTTFHNANGGHEGGAYSDHSTTVNKAITPYCYNCGERLPFKLLREASESVEG